MRPLQETNFKNKKVLVFGLGLLGGGVATTNWLLRQGAKVTVTDLKTKKQLASSLKQIKGRVKFKLGGHDERDIRQSDIVVFNPDIPVTSPYVKLARELGKRVENEATIFYELCDKPIIAVTGTRGKTTTVNWISHFLNAKKKTVVAGNSYVEPLLETLDRAGRYSAVVNEIPSYHLEYFDESVKAPEIAVITNVFQDHLNRHASFEEYAATKARIFKNQNAKQNLILNYDNDWTAFFSKQKPRAKVWFFSLLPLPADSHGVFYKDDAVFFKNNDKPWQALKVKGFIAKWGGHNLQNLLASSLATHLDGVSWAQIQRRIKTLPQIPFRQEVIYDGSIRLTAGNKRLKIINDTSATSPDGGIAVIDRFAGPDTILITGGTDRQLDYVQWAKAVAQKLKPENIIFISGSATVKMLNTLGWKADNRVFETLEECLKTALAKAGEYAKPVILFSPAAKSFEKFKNEFDRGRQFNLLVKKEIRKSPVFK